MKIIFTVEAELGDQEIIDKRTVKEDLEGELVKIKSGPYDNAFYGNIVDVVVQKIPRKP
jgi:hypothetical protein